MHFSHQRYSANGLVVAKVVRQKHLSKCRGLCPVLGLIQVGLILVFVGLGVIVVSMVSQTKSGGEVKGGGVVLVGPIPIVFGSDAKWATIAIVLAIVLILLTILLSLV